MRIVLALVLLNVTLQIADGVTTFTLLRSGLIEELPNVRHGRYAPRPHAAIRLHHVEDQKRLVYKGLNQAQSRPGRFRYR